MESWRRADVPVLPGSGPAPRLHDTASGELVLAAAGPVATLYACGITPYDATHIGPRGDLHSPGTCWSGPGSTPGTRSFTCRTSPTWTIPCSNGRNGTARTGVSWPPGDRTVPRDMEALRVLPPTRLIGAVEALPVIERFTARLADRGALYDVDEDVYFAGSADPGFGSLSGPGTACGYGPAEMAELARRARRRPGPPRQEGSARRPGLAGGTARRAGLGLPVRARQARLARGVRGDRHRVPGQLFDVQAGGSDLIFPHHEMSASHARVALARPAEPTRSPGCTCTPGWSAATARRCPSRWGNLVFV